MKIDWVELTARIGISSIIGLSLIGYFTGNVLFYGLNFVCLFIMVIVKLSGGS